MTERDRYAEEEAKWEEERMARRLRLKTAEDVLADRKRLAASKSAAVSAGYKQPHYVYRSLADSNDSFRLFRFVPSKQNGDVACQLSECRISDLPVYQALSYEWGIASDVTWISVDGRPFRIQTNLFVFLQKILSVSKPNQWFFADAICVDQGEIFERNYQVMLMGRIYSGAQSVLTWLGPPADDSEELYQLYTAAPKLTFKTLTGTLVDLFRTTSLTSVTRALVALANRSYWSRMWIVQEVLLARDIIMFCGSWVISWDQLEQLLALPAELYNISRSNGSLSLEELEQGLKRCRLANFVAHRRINFGSALIQPMPDMIEAYGQSECTDLRDRVYGLVGIARSSPDGYRLEVDYAQSEASLFFDVLQCYSVAYPVRFGRILNQLLRLDWALSCANLEELADRVNRSILSSLGNESFRVELEYAGQVGLTIDAPLKLDASMPHSNTSAGSMHMYHVSVGGTDSEECLFTCADAQEDEYVVRILHSEYAFIYRVTIRSPDSLQQDKRFDLYEYQERKFIGRGVLLRPEFATEAAQIILKDLRFGEHKHDEVYELISFGRRALISTGPSDFLVITTSLDDSRKWQGNSVADGPVVRTAPTGHTIAFLKMQRYKDKMASQGEDLETRYHNAVSNHVYSCRFDDCSLKSVIPPPRHSVL